MVKKVNFSKIKSEFKTDKFNISPPLKRIKTKVKFLNNTNLKIHDKEKENETKFLREDTNLENPN